jgi:putative membrane protein
MDLISLIVAILVAAVVLVIVDKLNLGLTVGSFMNAIIAAVVIAVVGWGLNWLLGLIGIQLPTGPSGGLVAAIIYFIVAAVILMIADRFLAGMSVKGFTGALVAAIAIAVLNWLVALLNLPNLLSTTQT